LPKNPLALALADSFICRERESNTPSVPRMGQMERRKRLTATCLACFCHSPACRPTSFIRSERPSSYEQGECKSVDRSRSEIRGGTHDVASLRCRVGHLLEDTLPLRPRTLYLLSRRRRRRYTSSCTAGRVGLGDCGFGDVRLNARALDRTSPT
jgi:hypothetical protein